MTSFDWCVRFTRELLRLFGHFGCWKWPNKSVRTARLVERKFEPDGKWESPRIEFWGLLCNSESRIWYPKSVIGWLGSQLGYIRKQMTQRSRLSDISMQIWRLTETEIETETKIKTKRNEISWFCPNRTQLELSSLTIGWQVMPMIPKTFVCHKLAVASEATSSIQLVYLTNLL